MQATSKEKHLNLRTRCVLYPVWIGPKTISTCAGTTVTGWIVVFQVTDFPYVSDAEDPSILEWFDLGSLFGQFVFQAAMSYTELRMCDEFYADKDTHQILKDKKFDLVFAESLYPFGR